MRQWRRWLCTAVMACGGVATTACDKDEHGEDTAGDTTGAPASTGDSSGGTSSGGVSSTFGIDPTLDSSDETGPVSTTFATTFTDGGDIGVPESSSESGSSDSGSSDSGSSSSSDSGSSDGSSSSDGG